MDESEEEEEFVRQEEASPSTTPLPDDEEEDEYSLDDESSSSKADAPYDSSFADEEEEPEFEETNEEEDYEEWLDEWAAQSSDEEVDGQDLPSTETRSAAPLNPSMVPITTHVPLLEAFSYIKPKQNHEDMNEDEQEMTEDEEDAASITQVEEEMEEAREKGKVVPSFASLLKKMPLTYHPQDTVLSNFNNVSFPKNNTWRDQYGRIWHHYKDNIYDFRILRRSAPLPDLHDSIILTQENKTKTLRVQSAFLQSREIRGELAKDRGQAIRASINCGRALLV